MITTGGRSVEAVLRMSGPQFDVDRFLRLHSELAPDAIWRVGDRGPLGRIANDSGFNVPIAIGEAAQPMPLILEELLGYAGVISDAHSSGAGVALHLGLMLDMNEMASTQVGVSAQQLALLARLDVDLAISTYLCSEDESESG